MARVLLVLLFSTGCSVGVPIHKKLNNNDAFLLTQKLNKDILCLKDQETPKTGTMRCYYVSKSNRSSSEQ